MNHTANSRVEEFFHLCERLTKEGYVAGRGGNCSIKFDEEILISPSGRPLGDNYCPCLWPETLADVTSEKEYFDKAMRLTRDRHRGRPSMEYGLHYLLPYRYVVHTHPIKLNNILCSEEAGDILPKIFRSAYNFIPYTTPGYQLFKKLESRNYCDPIIFLQNHGLIVCGDTEDEVFERLRSIETLVAGYLNPPLYPDAVCLPAENFETNRAVLEGIRRMGLTPKFLTSSEIEELKALEYEKHRASLL